MNAQDRLVAIIAQHPWYASPPPGARGYCLGCLGKPIPVGGTADWAEFATFSEYAAHLTAAITAADDLAVIQRPSLDDLAGAIGVALCAQEEAADSAGDQSWWGLGADDVAGIAAEGVAKLLGTGGAS